jgi:hypothetical protein
VKLPTEQNNGFTVADANRVLAAACEKAGLNGHGAELMRLGENALFRLAKTPVVVRIARSIDLLPDVQKEVGVARWLETADFPGVRLHPHVPQPIVQENRVITFWTFVRGSGRRATMTDLATLLRRLHRLTLPKDLALPSFDPFGRIQSRLDQTNGISDSHLEFLAVRLNELRSEYAQLEFSLPSGHIHGDAHPGNIIYSDDGRPLLLDFERFAKGPREWDISVAGIYCRGFHWITEDEYSEFVRIYGFDVTTWPGFRVLQSLREFQMTTWLMQNVDHSAEIRAEFENRLASLRNGTGQRDWRPF